MGKKRNPESKKERIFDEMPNSRKKAIEISKNFVHVKPVKLLKKKI